MQSLTYIRRFAELGIDDVPLVGGKNASLGEMYRALSGEGVKVPNGFATTAQAFRDYLQHNDLEERISQALAELPSKQREAVELIQVQGLSVAEAALRAGVSPGALKVRAHRGYRALRARLQGVQLS